jgi:YVTN family beta-propeller protein
METKQERLEWEEFEARRRAFDAQWRAGAPQLSRIDGPVLPPVCALTIERQGWLAGIEQYCVWLVSRCRRDAMNAIRRPFYLLGAISLFVLGTTSGRAYGQLPAASHVHHGSVKNGAAAGQFGQALMQSMARMDADMQAAPMTGDPDHDFSAMMIPHHQGAVDMAKAFLLHGKDPALRRLAHEIIVTQEQEIEVMRLRLAALQAPLPRRRRVTAPPPAGVPVSSRDRVYTADQTSNTVSVIDPAANRLLGVIRLGDPVPGALSPLYKGQLLVHGMGFSPDHRTLAVVSIGSNSVSLIDTATNRVKGVIYVGRSPHEAFFTPDGKEVWATVRGEDYVSVIDPVRMKEVRRVQVANGPGMVLFRPDGRYAFVPSSFTPEVDVVDTRTYRVVARVPQASPFSPNLAVSRDGTEVWFTLKDSGKVQVMSAQPPFRIFATLATGPITNHVALAENANGKFAYVTVGGQNQVKVYRRGQQPQLVATIPTGDLPHGIWHSGDGTRVYVGLENQDAVAAIDTLTNRVIAQIPIGQQPMALCYVPDAVPAGDGLANLVPLGEAGRAAHLMLAAPEGSGSSGHATVSINALGALDLLEIAVSGLEPDQEYQLWLVASPGPPYGDMQPLAKFKTNVSGAQIAQAIGPLRHVVAADQAGAGSERRYLLVTKSNSGEVVLTQAPVSAVGKP